MDPRKIKTKQKIKNSLIVLLNKMPLSKITISRLCTSAGINRGTFYLHFKDVNEALESLEDDLYEQIILSFENNHGNVLLHALKAVQKNRDLCKAILFNNIDRVFISKVSHIAWDYCLDYWKKVFPNEDLEAFSYIYSFISQGMIGIIMKWCETDFKQEPEEIAQIVSNISALLNISL